jgi:hypothetical protein
MRSLQGSREFEQHRCEPANDNAHAGALAGQDGQFPASAARLSISALYFDHKLNLVKILSSAWRARRNKSGQ